MKKNSLIKDISSQSRVCSRSVGFYLLIFILLFMSCDLLKNDPNKSPRNIILFIGDGMGVSQIDWAGHDMDHDYLIEELVDFDDAVGAGLDFAQKNGETLVIITTDHETGGYSVLDGSIADSTVTKTSFAWDHHTGVMVPLFAMGPGSEVFQGVYDNTFIGQTLIKFIRNILKE